MAAPHVSGALAVLLSQGLGPSAAVELLPANLHTSTSCGVGCRGRLDLRAAVTPPAPTMAPAGTTPPSIVVEPPADDDVDPALAGVAFLLTAVAAISTLVVCLGPPAGR